MEATLIKSIFRNPSDYFNKDIKISGWVKTIRDSKTFGFIEVNDGSFFKNIKANIHGITAIFKTVVIIAIVKSSN